MTTTRTIMMIRVRSGPELAPGVESEIGAEINTGYISLSGVLVSAFLTSLQYSFT